MTKVEITKEEYEALKEEEISSSNLDVYDYADTQQDADDIILNSDFVSEEVLLGQDDGTNSNFVYTSSDGGSYIDKTAPLSQTTTTASNVKLSANCSDIVNDFGPNLKVSKYFTLSDLATNEGHSDFGRIQDKYVEVAGVDRFYTKYQISCNMKELAVNVLDKIMEKYPDMRINCTIRNWGKKSEHETGQAADLRFIQTKKKDYIYIAQWIKSNCPWNQLFLEYQPQSNPKGGWIHVSYAAPGQNISASPKYWGTLYNNLADAPGSRKSFTNVMSKCDWT